MTEAPLDSSHTVPHAPLHAAVRRRLDERLHVAAVLVADGVVRARGARGGRPLWHAVRGGGRPPVVARWVVGVVVVVAVVVLRHQVYVVLMVDLEGVFGLGPVPMVVWFAVVVWLLAVIVWLVVLVLVVVMVLVMVVEGWIRGRVGVRPLVCKGGLLLDEHLVIAALMLGEGVLEAWPAGMIVLAGEAVPSGNLELEIVRGRSVTWTVGV